MKKVDGLDSTSFVQIELKKCFHKEGQEKIIKTVLSILFFYFATHGVDYKIIF